MGPDLPVRAVMTGDGVRVAAHHLSAGHPPLVLAHAAGFHGRVFLPLAQSLAGAGGCWAVDLRGHGDSPLPAGARLDWNGFAADVLAVVDALGLRLPLGVGHSSGATALLLAEQARPGTFLALYCFEPILVAGDPGGGGATGERLAAGARRRRDDFASRDAAMVHFSARPPLAALAPDALRAYVDHGFEDADAGGVRLKCRPEVEARVYETAANHDAFARLGEVACPVVVACGSSSDAMPAAGAAAVAARLPAGRSEVIEGVGHFGPLERPDVVAASVRAFLAEVAPA